MGFGHRTYRGIAGRVLNAIHHGNVDMLRTLFDLGILEADDRFDLTGHNRHGDDSVPEDNSSIMHIIGKSECPNYKELITLMLEKGVPLNEPSPCTPLEEAIMYQNFETAMYLEQIGGTYDAQSMYSMLPPYERFKLANPS